MWHYEVTYLSEGPEGAERGPYVGSSRNTNPEGYETVPDAHKSFEALYLEPAFITVTGATFTYTPC